MEIAQFAVKKIVLQSNATIISIHRSLFFFRKHRKNNEETPTTTATFGKSKEKTRE
jgi:hypothetical protein